MAAVAAVVGAAVEAVVGAAADSVAAVAHVPAVDLAAGACLARRHPLDDHHLLVVVALVRAAAPRVAVLGPAAGLAEVLVAPPDLAAGRAALADLAA
jgi:hypothetical protein